MSDEGATLIRMRAGVASEAGGGLARLEDVTRESIAESLIALGLDTRDVVEAAEAWEAFSAEAAWAELLAGVVAQVERQRVQREEPVALWGDLDALGDPGRLFYVFVAALAGPGTAEHLRQEGFPDDVVAASLDTISRHVRIHRRKTGALGVDAGWWTLLLLRGDLVNVGALQFHRYRLGSGALSPQPWYSEQEARARGDGFCAGDPAVGLHIPDGTDLSAFSVDGSLEAARRLLERCWPVSQRRLLTCQTWMFDDRLVEGLGAQSNIVRFASLFTMVPGFREGDEDVREFVLGRPRAGQSRLQSLVRDALREGGHWASRTGWIAWENAS